MSLVSWLADQHPDRVALECGDERLSYGALRERAQALAQRIVAMAGTHPEAVGIMCAPGPRMLVAIYGALLANKYYLPLDPHYPVQRLAAMVADADPVLILADPALHARASGIADGIPVLGADAPAPRAPVALPAVDPDGLAYVLYTSGSSGVPKGIMQNHANVMFHGATYARSIGMTADDRVALLASLCFDASVMDLFGALSCGATLLPFSASQTAPQQLLGELDRAKITVFHATPTLFRLLFGAGNSVAPPSIRVVVLGGEAVTLSDAALFRRRFGPAVTLINGYGPSESTMGLQFRIGPDTVLPDSGVPAGFPLPGLRASIGSAGAPSQALQHGELFLHSPHLFLGYLNLEEASAACFVTGSDGARYYRTGDLATRLADGSILVRGRVDQQIKFHGHRIEPGDIEAQLLAFAGIGQAAVRPGTVNGQEALLAYVGVGEGRIDEAALRLHLQERVPVQVRVVQMAALPRTPSGKIDRLALPDTIGDQDQLHAGDTRLAALWQQVLGWRPGRDTGFFAAGGHSLAALQLVGLIRQEFGIEYPLQRVMQDHTLAQMALDIASQSSVQVPLPPQRPAIIPLAPVQRGLWYLHQTSAAAACAYNMQIVLRLRGALDLDALERALAALCARHATLRTGFPGPAQDVHAAVQAVLRRVDVEHVHELAQQEAALPFDLARPPLLRMVAGQLAPGEHYLILTVHHLAADGWSLALMLRELGVLYAQPGALPPLALEYADYAVSQSARLDQAASDRLAQFWRGYLDGAPPMLRWKAADPAIGQHEGGAATFEVPAAVKDALVELGARHRATPFMILLALWGLQLAAESGQDDLVVGTAAANRPSPETQQLIGLFVNSLPIRVQANPDLPFELYLGKVRDAALAAFANQDLPFDRIVSALARSGAQHANPVFQAMLTYDAFGLQEAAALPGLDVTLVERAQQSSHVDLALSLRPLGSGWGATLTYARALFAQDEAERLARDFLALMHKVAAHPQLACGALMGDRHSHWRAERDAILDCPRLAPAAGTCQNAVPAGPADGRVRQLAAVMFTLWRWTGGAEVALRVAARGAAMPLRVRPDPAQSFAAFCRQLVQSYRTGARMRRHGGASMHEASQACQVQFDLGSAASDSAWLSVRREHGRLVMRGLPAVFDGTQTAWFAAAVAACLEHTAAADLTLGVLAGRIGAASQTAAPVVDLPSWSIARLLAQQAQRSPDALALVSGAERLSYRELDGKANALARQLLDSGAVPLSPVAILLEPGPAVPLCFLAALKAGLCLAPLDPAWPAARLAAVIEQLAPSLLVTAQLREDLPVPQFVYRDLAPVQLEFRWYTAPDHPVYIVHTSGTTGLPKAALNLQRGLLNRLLFMDRYFGAGAARSVLQTTPHWFDSALWQFFWPWLHGGCCVAEDLSEQLHSERISLADLTPSRLQGFLDNLAPGGAVPLEHMIIGGEMLSARSIAAFRARLPQVRLHNFYGPSETAIGVICADVSDCSPDLPVPIGRPIDNVYVRVVDRDGRPLPMGAVGELLIGGACVGGGYVGNAAETARQFIADPVPGGAYAMYRSGDLARYLADGSLQCLGRMDSQVKLRGLRIETLEIRHALESYPGVAQAHVRLHGEGEQARLIAYVVPEPPGGEDAAMRSHLAARLPAHMLPNTIIGLAELPLRSSGKIDEARLPVQAIQTLAEPVHGYRRAMAALWAQLLDCADIGANDDFFARGGNSLLTVQLSARIRQQFGVSVPLRLILGTPVLGPFADAVLRLAQGIPCPNPIALRKHGEGPPLFLVHGGDGELTYAYHLAAELAQGMPVYGFAAAGRLEGETPLDSVPALAAAYVAALRQIQPQGPYHLGGWSAGGMIAYEMARQLEAQGDAVATLFLIDTSCYALLDAAAMLEQMRRISTRGAVPLPDEHALAVRLALARAIHTYRREPPNCRTVLVNAAASTLGWHGVPQWHTVTLPGDHLSVVSAPRAGALARVLSSFLSFSPSPMESSS